MLEKSRMSLSLLLNEYRIDQLVIGTSTRAVTVQIS
jgi:hypothetical protein